MSQDVPAGDNAQAGDPLLAAKCKEEFADCLRALRAQAGTPSFRHLAKVTHYASSTLADATSGRRLPTEPVVKALVAACGADPDPWLDQLRRISAAEKTDAADKGDILEAGARPGTGRDGAGAADAPLARPAWDRRRMMVLSVGGLAVLAAGVAIGWLGASMSSPAPAASTTGMVLPGVPAFSGNPAPAPGARVLDGADPAAAGCKPDAHLVDRVPILLGGHQVGALDLHYSAHCGAGWASLYLYPGAPIMMGEVTVRSGDDRFTTIANPLIKQVDDYTDVIVPGPGGCLGAGAVVYEPNEPIMTATIPCEAPS